MTDSPRPRFIVFEGPDGCGKTTQAAAFARYLASADGTEPLCLREPTTGTWGRKIREAALSGNLPDPAEQVRWFTEDRREDVTLNIQPALAAGRYVVLDRYFYSTAAYQAAAGVPRAEILATNREFAPEPDVCFVLFCDPVEARRRMMRERGQPLDAFEGLDFQCRVIEQYRQIVAEVTRERRCPMIVIDTTALDADAIGRQIVEHYRTLLASSKEFAS